MTENLHNIKLICTICVESVSCPQQLEYLALTNEKQKGIIKVLISQMIIKCILDVTTLSWSLFGEVAEHLVSHKDIFFIVCKTLKDHFFNPLWNSRFIYLLA